MAIKFIIQYYHKIIEKEVHVKSSLCNRSNLVVTVTVVITVDPTDLCAHHAGGSDFWKGCIYFIRSKTGTGPRARLL